MSPARCPACNLPYALVGRAHRCVPRSAAEAETVLHTVPQQTGDDEHEVLQGRAARSARVAHNHEVGGSNPPPATIIPSTGKTGMAGVTGTVRRSTAGSELRVGALDADPAPVLATPAPEVLQTEGNPAGTQAIGAYQFAMGETPPSAGDGRHLYSTANREKPDFSSDVVPIRKPKRDRAAYMRNYRADVKKRKAEGAA